jgi:F0F1-type ATP synthase membrane subunit b/b'
MEDMTSKTTEASVRVEGEKSGTGLLVWVMAGVVLGLTIANVFLFLRTSEIEQTLARMDSSTAAEMASFEQRSSQTGAAMQQTMEELNRQLKESLVQAEGAAGRARTVAQRHAEKLVQTLAEEQKAQQQAQQQQIAEQLGEVREATEAKVSEIVSDVGNVKGQVAETRSTLDSTLTDLRSVRGDLGVQSGLIATNSKELAALRALGERNYFEFNFTKSNKPYKIGGILVSLKKTDAKRYKYTLDVVADDRKVEKKDKYINEPVQFYVAGSRLPCEIVVNEVHKDRIVGYLATPKLVQARR